MVDLNGAAAGACLLLASSSLISRYCHWLLSTSLLPTFDLCDSSCVVLLLTDSAHIFAFLFTPDPLCLSKYIRPAGLSDILGYHFECLCMSLCVQHVCCKTLISSRCRKLFNLLPREPVLRGRLHHASACMTPRIKSTALCEST